MCWPCLGRKFFQTIKLLKMRVSRLWLVVHCTLKNVSNAFNLTSYLTKLDNLALLFAFNGYSCTEMLTPSVSELALLHYLFAHGGLLECNLTSFQWWLVNPTPTVVVWAWYHLEVKWRASGNVTLSCIHSTGRTISLAVTFPAGVEVGFEIEKRTQGAFVSLEQREGIGALALLRKDPAHWCSRHLLLLVCSKLKAFKYFKIW